MAVVKEADFHKKDRTGLISRAEVVGEITSTMADDYCSYVGNELYCRSCGCECRTVHREYECPRCGSEDVFNSKFIPCDCGAEAQYTSTFKETLEYDCEENLCSTGYEETRK